MNFENQKPVEKKLSPAFTPEEVSERIENLYKTFDLAENIFETEGREKTKPFLNAIYTEMGILNDSVEKINPLERWHIIGYFKEQEFAELNLRRKKLSNAVGIMTSSGVIRHDLNKLD